MHGPHRINPSDFGSSLFAQVPPAGQSFQLPCKTNFSIYWMDWQTFCKEMPVSQRMHHHDSNDLEEMFWFALRLAVKLGTDIHV